MIETRNILIPEDKTLNMEKEIVQIAECLDILEEQKNIFEYVFEFPSMLTKELSTPQQSNDSFISMKFTINKN